MSRKKWEIIEKDLFNAKDSFLTWPQVIKVPQMKNLMENYPLEANPQT